MMKKNKRFSVGSRRPDAARSGAAMAGIVAVRQEILTVNQRQWPKRHADEREGLGNKLVGIYRVNPELALILAEERLAGRRAGRLAGKLAEKEEDDRRL
jgi:hypothetical protein